MRMRIHPAGRHQQPRRIDVAAGGPMPAAHFRDSLTFDCQVAGEGPLTCAVDDGSTPDDDVVHGNHSPI
jgi:hypothetical protein